MRILPDLKLTFDDVLLVPQFSDIRSRSTVDLHTSLGSDRLTLPIVSSNMDTITGVKMARKMYEMGGLGIVHRGGKDPDKQVLDNITQWSIYEQGKLFLSVGSTNRPAEKARLDAIFNYGRKLIEQNRIGLCVDLAHGDSTGSIQTIDHIRRTRQFVGTIIAGAVCTPQGVQNLVDAGADVVRVGIGPGSACLTRVRTGCGFPQLSAISECSKVRADIIADGGIRTPGDAAKALAAGAKAVMIGGMLKGTDHVPGWNAYTPVLSYRGMASNDAKKAAGLTEEFEEGVSIEVPNRGRGSTEVVVKGIEDGVRSAMSYCNSHTLEELRKNAVFAQVSAHCADENSAHAQAL